MTEFEVDSASQRPITIRDVAKYAHVSVATVSRVLNGATNVDPQMIERVQAAASQLNYQPSRAARVLAGRGSLLLGLLVTDMQNAFYLDMIRGAEELAQKAGYLLIVCNTLEDIQREEQYLEALIAEPVAGVILVPAQGRVSALKLCKARHIPVVVADRRIDDRAVDTVLIDNVSAAREAVTHLIENGYRRIGVLSGPSSVTNANERVLGYQRALQEANISFDEALVKRGPLTSVETATQLTHSLLDLTPPPEAIVAMHNRLAVGARRAIYERQMRVPEDMALVGFDVFHDGGSDDQPMTSVNQSAYDLGCTAASRLLQLLQTPGIPKQEIILQYQLQIQGSSRPRSASGEGERKARKASRS